MRSPMAVRRLGSCRLVLGAVFVTAIVVASLAAALASIATQTLPQAARRQLAASRNTSIAISGALDQAQATADATAIRSALRSSLRPVPFTLYGSLWSDSLGLPTGYGSQPVPLTRAAAPDAIKAQATLIHGSWPGKPAAGQPVPAAIPTAVATRLRLTVGAVLPVRDRDTDAPARLRVTGVFRPIDPAAPYWRLDIIGSGGAAVAGGFITYGPFVVDPAAFGGAGLQVGAASWVVMPQTARIAAGNLGARATMITQSESYLRQSPALGGLEVTSALPALLRNLATNLTVARSLLIIGALQLILVAAAAVLLAAHLLAGQRAAESAMLTARGGSRAQLAMLNAAEAVPLAAASVLAGALLGSRLAGLISGTGPLGAAGLRIPAITPAAWWAAAAGGALCLAAILVPAARPPTPGAARVERGRQAAVAGAVRAGADVALVALAGLAGWQLHRYSAVARTGSGIGVDPVLALAPALALAGGAAVTMRLLPLGARLLDRSARGGKRLVGALASWEISRRPVRHSGPALLAVLAVATGTLALAQWESWRRSASDQAAFATGADVRVDTQAPVPLGLAATVARAPGVREAMPVARVDAAAAGIVLAVDARKAAATVLLRPDQSSLPASSLWRPLIAGAAPGVAVPGSPARLEIVASLGPPDPRLGSAQVSLSVQDAAGLVYSVPAGTLSADGQSHALIASLAPARRAVYPLRLLGISLAYTMPAAPAAGAVLTFGSVATSAADAGPFNGPFARGSALRAWHPAVTSQAATAARLGPQPGVAEPRISRWLPTASGAQSLSFGPGHGMASLAPGAPVEPVPADLTVTAGAAAAVIPGIATQAFLDATSATVGSVIPITIGGATIPVRIAAAVATFPTVTGPGGALVVDQATTAGMLAAESADPLAVTEWWLRAAAVPPGLPAAATVTDRAAVTAALTGDPLPATPQQALLAVAAGTALLAALGFAVSIAASVTERRSQDALLGALGMSRAARAGQLCAEELILSLPSAACGLLLGALLAKLLVPAVTLTTGATTPIPAPLVEYAWAPAAALALLVAALPALTAAFTVARRRDPAAQLRAAESG